MKRILSGWAALVTLSGPVAVSGSLLLLGTLVVAAVALILYTGLAL